MLKLKLVWGVIWRMTLLGLGGGASLGCLFGLAVMVVSQLLRPHDPTFVTDPTMDFGWIILGSLAGAFFGGIVGLLLGLVNGIILAIEVFILRPVTQIFKERVMLQLISSLIVGLGTASISLAVIPTERVPIADQNPVGLVLWAFLPASIASIAAWFACAVVVKWVDEESRRY